PDQRLARQPSVLEVEPLARLIGYHQPCAWFLPVFFSFSSPAAAAEPSTPSRPTPTRPTACSTRRLRAESSSATGTACTWRPLAFRFTSSPSPKEWPPGRTTASL